MGKLLEQYQALVLALFGTALVIIWNKADSVDDKVEAARKELTDKLHASDLLTKDLSNMVQMQAQDVNNTINRKIDALEQRLPSKSP
jgi:hypothetical protein